MAPVVFQFEHHRGKESRERKSKVRREGRGWHLGLGFFPGQTRTQKTRASHCCYAVSASLCVLRRSLGVKGVRACRTLARKGQKIN